MFNKHKFVANPQLDAEGFTDHQAPCVGCGPAEPCFRSGHCTRYDSPLRFMEPVVISAEPSPFAALWSNKVAMDKAARAAAEAMFTMFDEKPVVDVGAMIAAHEAARESNALVLGWAEKAHNPTREAMLPNVEAKIAALRNRRLEDRLADYVADLRYLRAGRAE